jgi:hypothetical protein
MPKLFPQMKQFSATIIIQIILISGDINAYLWSTVRFALHCMVPQLYVQSPPICDSYRDLEVAHTSTYCHVFRVCVTIDRVCFG